MWFSSEGGYKWYHQHQVSTKANLMSLSAEGILHVPETLQIGTFPARQGMTQIKSNSNVESNSGTSSHIPHGNRLEITGAPQSMYGPHIRLSTTEPRLHCVAWDCNDISIGLDTYYDLKRQVWVPTSESSSFRIHKRQNELVVLAGPEKSAIPFAIHKTGHVTIDTNLFARRVLPVNDDATIGTRSDAFAAVHTKRCVLDYSDLSGSNFTYDYLREALEGYEAQRIGRYHMLKNDRQEVDIGQLLPLLVKAVQVLFKEPATSKRKSI